MAKKNRSKKVAQRSVGDREVKQEVPSPEPSIDGDQDWKPNNPEPVVAARGGKSKTRPQRACAKAAIKEELAEQGEEEVERAAPHRSRSARSQKATGRDGGRGQADRSRSARGNKQVKIESDDEEEDRGVAPDRARSARSQKTTDGGRGRGPADRSRSARGKKEVKKEPEDEEEVRGTTSAALRNSPRTKTSNIGNGAKVEPGPPRHSDRFVGRKNYREDSSEVSSAESVVVLPQTRKRSCGLKSRDEETDEEKKGEPVRQKKDKKDGIAAEIRQTKVAIIRGKKEEPKNPKEAGITPTFKQQRTEKEILEDQKEELEMDESEEVSVDSEEEIEEDEKSEEYSDEEDSEEDQKTTNPRLRRQMGIRAPPKNRPVLERKPSPRHHPIMRSLNLVSNMGLREAERSNLSMAVSAASPMPPADEAMPPSDDDEDVNADLVEAAAAPPEHGAVENEGGEEREEVEESEEEDKGDNNDERGRKVGGNGARNGGFESDTTDDNSSDDSEEEYVCIRQEVSGYEQGYTGRIVNHETILIEDDSGGDVPTTFLRVVFRALNTSHWIRWDLVRDSDPLGFRDYLKVINEKQSRKKNKETAKKYAEKYAETLAIFKAEQLEERAERKERMRIRQLERERELALNSNHAE